jgi:hypothetical protein
MSEDPRIKELVDMVRFLREGYFLVRGMKPDTLERFVDDHARAAYYILKKYDQSDTGPTTTEDLTPKT